MLGADLKGPSSTNHRLFRMHFEIKFIVPAISTPKDDKSLFTVAGAMWDYNWRIIVPSQLDLQLRNVGSTFSSREGSGPWHSLWRPSINHRPRSFLFLFFLFATWSSLYLVWCQTKKALGPAHKRALRLVGHFWSNRCLLLSGLAESEVLSLSPHQRASLKQKNARTVRTGSGIWEVGAWPWQQWIIAKYTRNRPNNMWRLPATANRTAPLL